MTGIPVQAPADGFQEPVAATHARPRATGLVTALSVTLVAFVVATHMRTDADLWGHVRFGIDTLHSWSLPADDPYSFTQDTPWINHEWLSELQMGYAWEVGGTTGLALLKGALTLTGFVLIWTALRQVRLRVRIAIIAVVFFGTVHMSSSLRPQLWTFVFFAILCRVLIAATPVSRRWLPLLFALWANHHGGWIVGLGVLAVWAAADVLVERASWREWGILVTLCLAATLATPYGWSLWEFILRTVRMERAVAEWLPLWTTHVLNWPPWALAVASAVWAARRSTRYRVPTVAVLAMLAYASLRVLRLESLFVEAAAILLAPVFAGQWPRRSAAIVRHRSTSELAVASAVLVVASGISVWIGSSTLRCIQTRGYWAPDAEAMVWLKSAQEGWLVTTFDWGQYAIWHLQPRIRVSMDGRRETVYTDRRIDENRTVVWGTDEGLRTLAAWRPEYVWLPATSVTTKDWTLRNGYRVEVVTGRSYVAVRSDLPPLARPGSPAQEPRCFPQ